MKSICTLLIALPVFVCVSAAQEAPQPRTDLYHIHFAKAAPGKAMQVADFLKTPDPKAPMPGHVVVLRHQEGDDWDYVAIEHLGKKATVDAAGTPPPPAILISYDWHSDTFVSGPGWAEFARAMGIDGQSATGTAGSVYVVSVYRAVPGHRDQLEKAVSEPPGAGDKASGNVVMQHVEGDAWQYLSIVRYNSWQDYAAMETSTKAQTLKGAGGWFQMREHAAFHRDTLADRIAP
jgi:hypothetical protein